MIAMLRCLAAAWAWFALDVVLLRLAVWAMEARVRVARRSAAADVRLLVSTGVHVGSARLRVIHAAQADANATGRLLVAIVCHGQAKAELGAAEAKP